MAASARLEWRAAFLASLFLATTAAPLASAQEELQPRARFFVASLLEVNESRASQRGQLSSPLGGAYDGFQGFLTEGGHDPNVSVLAIAASADALRHGDLAGMIRTAEWDPAWDHAPFYEAIGPVVVVLENVTPPQSREGTFYDALSHTFHFSDFLTAGIVRAKNLLVVWCEGRDCLDIRSDVLNLFAEESLYFLPLVATTTRDESRMDALASTMPMEAPPEKAAPLFQTAALIETNATRQVMPSRVGVARSVAPTLVVEAFDAAHETQAEALAERRLQLAERASSYRDQLARAADYSRAREQAAYNGQILTFNWLTVGFLAAGVLVSAAASVVSAVIAHRAMRQQHENAEAMLSLQREHLRHARSDDAAPRESQRP